MGKAQGLMKIMYPFKIIVILIVFACSSVYGSEKATIDSFEYDQVWKPMAESPPVELTPHKTDLGEQALSLRCDFSRKADRCYWDREVSLDLSKFGRFSLWVYAENPQAVRNGNLYFQSGNGWFSGRLPVGKEGWQKMYLWKSDFQIEDSPQGWGKISKIRLSFWNASNIDTLVAVDDLEAFASEIMVVLDDSTIRKDPQKARSVQSYCNAMTEILKGSGLDFGVVTGTDVESGALSGCKFAILPYNPEISEREYERMRQFVRSGGKLMLFYLLPDRLADILGIESVKWTQEQYPGQFASIKMKVDALEGLPEKVSQKSWSVMVPKSKGPETKIIGQWVDIEGKNLGIPAVALHKNGVFVGHVPLANDFLNKNQMLLALLGGLVPDMRQSVSAASLQNVGTVAGFQSFSDTTQFTEDNAKAIPEARRAEVLEYLAKSRESLALAEQASDSNQYGETLKMSRKATDELQEAFFRSFPAREGEFRAVWCHSAFGIPGWDWDKAIKTLKENGFNAIVVNMLRAGLTHYPSEVLPVSEEIAEKGDQIAQCLEACRKYGVQLHVWKVNWNLSRAPNDFMEKLRKAGRLQKDREGNEVNWLCPSNPENLKLELESMLEIVRKYAVDGIHFDYIRYPNDRSCYCPDCRKRFEESKGVKVKSWPEDVINGANKEDFVQWKCQQITNLVKAVSERSREINPEAKISAAVFRDYPRCRETVGQDWKVWIESGYLDFVCPMDYTSSNDQFGNWVANQVEVVNKRIPLYPGIGASAPGLPPEQVAMQAYIAQKLDVDGFIIFNYDLWLAQEVLPALSKGLTSSVLVAE